MTCQIKALENALKIAIELDNKFTAKSLEKAIKAHRSWCKECTNRIGAVKG